MRKKGSGWKGESRRHSLARKRVKTVLPDGRRFDVSKFVANGYEGYEDIIHSQEYEGLDGFYHLLVFKDGSYRLETPSGLEFGEFDQEGYSYRAKYQEPDIEEWINSVGTDLVNNEGHKFKASGKKPVMKKYKVTGLDSIRFDSKDDLNRRLKSFPPNAKVISAKRGWADIMWEDTFLAKSDKDAIKIVETQYESNTLDLYEGDKHIEEWL